MGGFAGWSLLGSSSGLIANFGCTIVLNVFFGTILNAAQAIVSQISGQLSVFGSTLSKAINPLIDKSLGSGNRIYMLKISMFSTKISFFLLSIVYLPFLVQIPLILKLWIKVVPPYTIIFCIFQLLRNLIEQLYFTISSTIAAEGKIKSYSIFSSFFTLLPLPITYFLFKLSYPPYYMYIIFTIYSFFYGGIVLYFVNKISHLSINIYFKEIFARCTLSFFSAFIIAFFSTKLYSAPMLSLVFSSVISLISLAIFIWFFGINREEKILLRNVFLSFISKRIPINI